MATADFRVRVVLGNRESLCCGQGGRFARLDTIVSATDRSSCAWYFALDGQSPRLKIAPNPANFDCSVPQLVMHNLFPSLLRGLAKDMHAPIFA